LFIVTLYEIYHCISYLLKSKYFLYILVIIELNKHVGQDRKPFGHCIHQHLISYMFLKYIFMTKCSLLIRFRYWLMVF